MKDLKYSEILKQNNSFEFPSGTVPYKVAVLGNVVISQIKEVLEYGLRREGLPAEVELGDYDNIVQDGERFRSHQVIIVFWELCNLVEGFQYKSNVMDGDRVGGIVKRVKNEIDLFFQFVEKTSLVIVNRFSTLLFNADILGRNKFDEVGEELNAYMAKVAPSNVILIDIDRIVARLSIERSADFRYFYSSKMLYTVEFFKHYVEYIKFAILSVNGKNKKAVIFDCDNTLWKGVLGEDGFYGIKMSSAIGEGAVFEEIQSLALEMKNNGVLVCICSKNNSRDVDEVLENHPDMVLREKDLVIKKVNWQDKTANIREIAEDLNIGLDSMVFIDDSDFEIGLIKESLKEVKALKVPNERAYYPGFMRESANLFFKPSKTQEDGEKTGMYKAELRREESRNQYRGFEEYLRSLGLEMGIVINDKKNVPRLAQLTQKTNQFNLTTIRYTETDIKSFINSPYFLVFSFSVKDKFGDNGTVGLCLVEKEEDGIRARIDSFLMSCRVIGRNIEFAFFDFLIKFLEEGGCRYLEGKYVKTVKNSQVSEFYETLGFKERGGEGKERNYELEIPQYQFKNHNYISVKYGRKD